MNFVPLTMSQVCQEALSYFHSQVYTSSFINNENITIPSLFHRKLVPAYSIYLLLNKNYSNNKLNNPWTFFSFFKVAMPFAWLFVSHGRATECETIAPSGAAFTLWLYSVFSARERAHANVNSIDRVTFMECAQRSFYMCILARGRIYTLRNNHSSITRREVRLRLNALDDRS